MRELGWFKTRFPDPTPAAALDLERVWAGPESGQRPRYQLRGALGAHAAALGPRREPDSVPEPVAAPPAPPHPTLTPWEWTVLAQLVAHAGPGGATSGELEATTGAPGSASARPCWPSSGPGRCAWRARWPLPGDRAGPRAVRGHGARPAGVARQRWRARPAQALGAQRPRARTGPPSHRGARGARVSPELAGRLTQWALGPHPVLDAVLLPAVLLLALVFLVAPWAIQGRPPGPGADDRGAALLWLRERARGGRGEHSALYEATMRSPGVAPAPAPGDPPAGAPLRLVRGRGAPGRAPPDLHPAGARAARRRGGLVAACHRRAHGRG